jgi:hypothetical protein
MDAEFNAFESAKLVTLPNVPFSRADWRHTFPNVDFGVKVVGQLLSQTVSFSADSFFSTAATI